MKKFAVAFISFMDNELTIEFHEANTWLEALSKHSKIDAAWFKELVEPDGEPDSNVDLKDAKQWAFDADSMIDVKEIL